MAIVRPPKPRRKYQANPYPTTGASGALGAYGAMYPVKTGTGTHGASFSEANKYTNQTVSGGNFTTSPAVARPNNPLYRPTQIGATGSAAPLSYSTGPGERKIINYNGQQIRLGPNSTFTPKNAPQQGLLDQLLNALQGSSGPSGESSVRGALPGTGKGFNGLASPVAYRAGLGVKSQIGSYAPSPNQLIQNAAQSGFRFLQNQGMIPTLPTYSQPQYNIPQVGPQINVNPTYGPPAPEVYGPPAPEVRRGTYGQTQGQVFPSGPFPRRGTYGQVPGSTTSPVETDAFQPKPPDFDYQQNLQDRNAQALDLMAQGQWPTNLSSSDARALGIGQDLIDAGYQLVGGQFVAPSTITQVQQQPKGGYGQAWQGTEAYGDGLRSRDSFENYKQNYRAAEGSNATRWWIGRGGNRLAKTQQGPTQVTSGYTGSIGLVDLNTGT